MFIYFFLAPQSNETAIGRSKSAISQPSPYPIAGEITLVRPLDEISAITHIGDPVLLTVIAEEVKVARNEPAAMASTVQLALFLPERSNSPPYFENDQ
jgi:hypothetical protein